MYDEFSTDYDRFTNWPARLSAELPFLIERLQALSTPSGEPPRVLDTACGTGMHAIALSQQGFTTAGADFSAGMVRKARENASAAGVNVRFEMAGFGGLSEVFGSGSFDALLCLGNSMPHVLDPFLLAAALKDFAACLRPSGLLVIQNRNFDAVMANQDRWMEPQAQQDEQGEVIFVRFYDFDPDGLLTFNLIILKRENSPWRQQVISTRLRPLVYGELFAAIQAAGFREITVFGNMGGAVFDPESSGNLVLTAVR